MKNIIPPNTLISNFIKSKNLSKIYTPIVIKHIIAFLTAMVIKGFKAKLTDVAEISNCHRTTLGHFISKSNWDEEHIKTVIKNESYQYIKTHSENSGEPLFVSIDDTVNCKTLPSSQALNPIQEAAFHHSHLLKKRVWGHQVMAMMVSCGDVALNYDIHRYNKKEQTKIEYAVEQIGLLPIPQNKAYVMADSWYTNGKIIDACFSSGYYYIGSMKTNRIIYPQGFRISIAEFADKYIEQNDVDLVTVNEHEYYVYRYEGKLNGIDNAVVLLSWPKDSFKNPKTLRAFICTDTELETATILEYHGKRWCIETFFGQQKSNLGFGKYQIRSIRGIDRLWTLMSLCHLLCTTGLGVFMPFGDGLRFLRKKVKEEHISFIYQCAQKSVPIEDIHALCI